MSYLFYLVNDGRCGNCIVLFEVGIHVDLKTLMAMKKDVSGFGLSQFTISAGVIAGICNCLGFSMATRMNFIWWCLTLRSSAFVFQLLEDKDRMES